jgi:hypothetical protein
MNKYNFEKKFITPRNEQSKKIHFSYQITPKTVQNYLMQSTQKSQASTTMNVSKKPVDFNNQDNKFNIN